MSRKRKAIYDMAKTLDKSLSGCKFTFQGQIVSDPIDNQIIHDGYLMMSLLWFDLLGITPEQYLRIMGTWISTISPLPVDKIDTVLSTSNELLIRKYVDDIRLTYTSFLQEVRGVDDRAKAILAPIRTLLISAFTDTTVESFRKAHQALVFISRLTLVNSNKTVEQDMLDSFLDTDIFTYDPVAEELKPFFDRHFRYFSLIGARGSHSNGATYELKRSEASLINKYLEMRWDYSLNLLSRRSGDFPPFIRYEPLRRVARLVMVPKSTMKRRAITVEPTSLVWYQHMVRDAIIRMIRLSPHLRQHAIVDEPERNRALAWIGSRYGDFSTIDLSSASDSVMNDSIIRTFPSQLRTACEVTRSRMIELPDGSLYRPNKYAGMGNATTFAVEDLMFCAIVEKAISNAGASPHSSLYVVHGDDIVVESEYFDSTVMELERHGFTINHDKTFTVSPYYQYRESCGSEWLNGYDVTTTKISRGFRGLRSRDPGSILGTIELANDVKDRFLALRLYLIDWLLANKREYWPYFTQYEEGLHVDYPWGGNIHLRYSKSQQNWLIQHGSLKQTSTRSRHEESMLYELCRYDMYLRSCIDRSRLLYPEDRIDVTLDRPTHQMWAISLTLDH